MKATHLIIVKFWESYPPNYTKEMVWAAVREKLKEILGDKLEEIQVVKLEEAFPCG